MGLPPFHVAVPVHDLEAARSFYSGLLGCSEGRSDSRWVDFNLYGHQFVCHLSEASRQGESALNLVDGEQVPVPHYGVVLSFADWEQLVAKLKAGDADFLIAPDVRFAGQPGEQATFFIADPSGNVLEFKALRNLSNLFAVQKGGDDQSAS